MNKPQKPNPAVGCSAWLDGKTCNDSGSTRNTSGAMYDSERHLREVYNYPGHAAVIRDAAKKKGMRFDEAGFRDGEITYTKDNIMVLRGDAAKFLNRLFECDPSRITRKQTPLLLLRSYAGAMSAMGYRFFDVLRAKFSHGHKRPLPSNEQAEPPRADDARMQLGRDRAVGSSAVLGEKPERLD